MLLGAALLSGVLVPASSQPQKRKIIFSMPVAPPNVVHTPVELAKQLGYMDKFGIDLDVKDFEGSTRGLTAAIAGGVNIGYINCEEAYGNGVPLVGFYDTAAKLPVMMIARDSIKTIKDLKGKKVGLSSPPGGFIDRMNRAALAAAGLKVEDVTVVPTTTAGRVAALVSGQTDTAVFHDYRGTVDPLQAWPEWYGAWMALGNRHEGLAAEAAREDRPMTAGEAHYRAALAYHFAVFCWVENLDEYDAGHRKRGAPTSRRPGARSPSAMCARPAAASLPSCWWSGSGSCTWKRDGSASRSSTRGTGITCR
ncbi:MAG TPA: ABC transporter substrate-binding protein [bacterium]|nr:ABC transporter substrate-binding protein [bacterium]